MGPSTGHIKIGKNAVFDTSIYRAVCYLMQQKTPYALFFACVGNRTRYDYTHRKALGAAVKPQEKLMSNLPRYQTAIEKTQNEPVHRAGHGRKGILALPFSRIIQTDPSESKRGFPEMQPPGGRKSKK